MSLVYLYIDDYRNFKKQNINFGDKYFFTYNEHTKELKKEENKLYIEDFYSVKNTKTNTKISNVTGIVGANGSGKSSILSFLLGSSLKFSTSQMMLDFIMIYKRENEYTIYHTSDLKIKNTTDFNIESVEFESGDSPIKMLLSKGGRFFGIEDTTCLYLSNIVDFNNFFTTTNHNQLINLSTNHLMKDGRNEYIKKDLNSKVKFLSKEKSEKLKGDCSKEKRVPFIEPQELQIISSYDYWLKISNGESPVYDKDEDYFKHRTEEIRNLTNKLTSLKGYEDGLSRILYNSLLQYLFNDLIASYIFIDEADDPIIVDSTIEGIMNDFYDYLGIKSNELEKVEVYQAAYVRSFIIELADKLVEIQKGKSKGKEIYLEKRVAFLKSLTNIHNLRSFDNGVVLFEITENVLENINTYFDSVHNVQYIDFMFRDLSSGEGALLAIYSRFYSIREQINKISSKNLTIILDEFDLYLHPHWQKKFLKTFIEFLTEIYIDKNIQIIFATNSPIPISDVLGYNMVFLETENGNSVVRTTLNEQHDTFAANIHTLYSDSFFVQDGLIGDLATTKINEVISYLKDKSNENPFKNGTELRQFILQIGESLIKNKLLTMYNDKYNLSIHTRLDEIEKRIGLDNDKD